MKKYFSIDEIKNNYDQDYRDLKFGGPDYIHEWILKILRPLKKKRLLDIGCGQGVLLSNAEKVGLFTYGIDISSQAIEIAKKNTSHSVLVCDDAHNLLWEDSFFDYITNIGSLEHFLEPERCLKEMYRVMKKEATACIMVPNLYYYRHIINKLFFNKKPTSYQLVERFESLGTWKRLIEKNGFRIKKIYKYNKFNRPMILRFIRSMLIPLRLSHHFVFICKK